MKTEKVLAVFSIVAFILYFFKVQGSILFLTISLFSLSILYFPLAFFFFRDRESKKQNIGLSIGAGFLLAIIPIGLLFKILHWKGGDVQLVSGIIGALIILTLTYYLKLKGKEELHYYYSKLLLRTGLLLILSVVFYLIPA